MVTLLAGSANAALVAKAATIDTATQFSAGWTWNPERPGNNANVSIASTNWLERCR